MADYSAFLTLANRLIAKKGAEMDFLRLKVDGAINPVTGKREQTEEQTSFIGVCVRPTEKEIATGHFQGVSQVVLAPGDAIEKPTVSDRLRFSGHDWDITEVVTIAPAGVPVLYKIGVSDAGPCPTT